MEILANFKVPEIVTNKKYINPKKLTQKII